MHLRYLTISQKNQFRMAKYKSSPILKIGKARKARVMIRTFRTLKKRRMQRNAKVGLFTTPSIFNDLELFIMKGRKYDCC